MQEVTEYLAQTFNHRSRQIDQFPFNETQKLVCVPSPVCVLSHTHQVCIENVLDFLRKNSVEVELQCLLALFLLENFHTSLSKLS